MGKEDWENLNIAREVSLPLLQSTLEEARNTSSGISFSALHLGSWLASISQFLDPFAYSRLATLRTQEGTLMLDSFKQSAEAVLKEILSTLQPVAGENIRLPLNVFSQDFINQSVHGLLAHLNFFSAGASWKSNALATHFIRDLCFLTGYYQFVAYSDFGAKPMKFADYNMIFGTKDGFNGTKPSLRAYTFNQYFPHQQFDRPVVTPLQQPTRYAPRAVVNKRAGSRAESTTPARPGPDLYPYLRDDIEMLAGLFAEIDQSLEQQLSEKINDENPSWHKVMTKLGYALHQVNKFFERTNWVELAISCLADPKYLTARAPSADPSSEEINTLLLKGLKQQAANPPATWQEHTDENWVVSGCVDFYSTIFTIANVWQTFFNDGDANPGLTHLQKILRNAFSFINTPRKAVQDEQNTLALLLAEDFPVDEVERRRTDKNFCQQIAENIVSREHILHEVEPNIKTTFINVIVAGSQFFSVAGVNVNLYQSFFQIAQFLLNPFRWLVSYLPEKDSTQFLNLQVRYDNRRVVEILQAHKIGSRLLLSKLQGFSRSGLYQKQHQCAAATQHYIVKTLLRWRDPDWRNAFLGDNYLDWLTFLEFFFQNPFPSKPSRYVHQTLVVRLTHEVKQGDQLKSNNRFFSLVDKYKPTAVDRNKFTWRTIADANFGTQDMPEKQARETINKILSDPAFNSGIPVTPPNYAFKPGVKMLIPQQQVPVRFPLFSERNVQPWFKVIFDSEEGWHAFRDKYPFSQNPAHPIRYVTQAKALRLIARGNQLRRNANVSYEKLTDIALADSTLQPQPPIAVNSSDSFTRRIYRYFIPSGITEWQFALSNFEEALAIGSAKGDSLTLISPIAARFPINISNHNNLTPGGIAHEIDGSAVGTPTNAFRHALWQALITARFDDRIAQEAGDSHESGGADALNRYQIAENNGVITVSVPAQIDFTNRAMADRTADLLNNILGRTIGLKNRTASNREMAIRVLDYYRDHGLWQIEFRSSDYRPNEHFPIRQVRVSPDTYSAAHARLFQLGDSGFTLARERELRDEQGTNGPQP